MRILLGFHLLDRQIVDRDGEAVGKVDDVELRAGPDGVPVVSALLVGQEALGRRLGGTLGGWLAGAAGRLRAGEPGAPIRIPYDVVADVGSAIRLSVRRELLPEAPLETWLREHLITRIPGADHAS